MAGALSLVACPHCRGQIQNDGRLAGQSVNCPHCARQFTMPHPVIATTPPQPDPLSFTSPGPTNVQVNFRERRQQSNSLGIAAIVLGIVGLLFSWLPMVGLCICAFGALLGFIAVLVSAARRGAGVGFAIAGLLLSVVGGTIGVIVTTAAGAAVAAIGEAIESAGVPVKQAQPTNGNSSNGTAEQAAPTTAEKWEPMNMAIALGDKVVWISSVTVGRVPIKESFSGGTAHSKDDGLLVRMKVKNRSSHRKLIYPGLGRERIFGPPPTSLVDNFGNTYRPVSFGINSIEGSASRESVYPGKTIDDAIAFEEPVAGVEYLHLKIDGSVLGESGELRFEIPAASIRRD